MVACSMMIKLKYITFVIGLMWINYPQTAYSIGVALPFQSIEQLNTIEMESKEIWKDVVCYEGLYQVSNFGRVKSLKFTIDRVMKTRLNSVGYYKVNLYKNGTKITKRVHQLVAESFLKHKPNGYKLVVNHKDFNMLNNNLDNLEVVTARDNTNKKHLNSSSKYTGVIWEKSNKKWRARIVINGKLKHLGCFTNEYKAHLAYENELKMLTNDIINA